jgi:hypothetical protein
MLFLLLYQLSAKVDLVLLRKVVAIAFLYHHLQRQSEGSNRDQTSVAVPSKLDLLYLP